LNNVGLDYEKMKLNSKIIEKIYNHALQEYPYECCGIITGSSDTQQVHLCENIQDRLHAEDPVRYPADARTAYMIDRSKFDGIVASAQEQGEHIIAVYHSHPEHEAYFSEEDVAAQTVFGEPEFPDAVYVVVSVFDRKIHDAQCYKWDRQIKQFTNVRDFLEK
jgi:proteasome lid subunit RPN8/RPN11